MAGATPHASATESLRDEVLQAFKEYGTELMPEDVRSFGHDQIIIHTVDGGLFEVTVRNLS